MNNNLNRKNDEDIKKDEKYYKKEFRKINIVFLLSIIKFILYLICFFTIFSDNVIAVSLNIFSAYFIWVITTAVYYLINAPLGNEKFKIFEFKYFILNFLLLILKILA